MVEDVSTKNGINDDLTSKPLIFLRPYDIYLIK